jgi:hypothetical protein
LSSKIEIVFQGFRNKYLVTLEGFDTVQSLGEDQPILERTRIVKDPKEIVSRARCVIETSNWLSVCSTLGWLRTIHNAASDLLEEILEKYKRGEHKGVRWICPTDKRDLDAVKTSST